MKPSGARDCFPLPSPLVEEGISPVIAMAGGLVPTIPEQVGSTSRLAEPYFRTMNCVEGTGLSLVMKRSAEGESQF